MTVPAPASGRTVLVADDDPAIRRVVRAVLEADGFRVVEATDGPQALRLLGLSSRRRADVAVIDVMMPGCDGVEVCRRIDNEAVKVVMLTARDDAVTRAAASEAGAGSYLVKPFSAIELLDAVEAALGP